MRFSEKWQTAFEARDRPAFCNLIDDDFEFIRHLSGTALGKEEIINIWTKDGPRPERRDYRIVYENDELLVSHQFIHFPNGSSESVLVVMLLKNGKLTRMETGATPMPS
ncbi:nuclear transport factor 2 family protein [Labrenzia sp. VG12]|uniref:nuclear transport factor 2 family protein n=1 Tax=Labrenzia sp. VG12 TaxID=2021862 RepID=UPI0012FDF902|nr:nuclear transport factor 2 family protein [Labrenzia sp. VG12]